MYHLVNYFADCGKIIRTELQTAAELMVLGIIGLKYEKSLKACILPDMVDILKQHLRAEHYITYSEILRIDVTMVGVLVYNKSIAL